MAGAVRSARYSFIVLSRHILPPARAESLMQAFYAAQPESGMALTLDERATIALLLGHGVIPIRTWGSFDDPELVVEIYGKNS
ncbi:hypothetical protein B0W47_03740 [Komagataeibacter nataicola]|uniref:Uncharacterized protein n=2 Tax=Komagataeibacter nataicola TaxID=265960 RepID=A0A9N7CFW0_9PROT|nr:hypothetical protein [Komagataeibacter nataicola]AQU86720.1 hypothetical protein B0W47_03740 [Komagataeibacter nataicola]PYD65776.1 hypothetical protein CDI09_11915 [Komagataeibacter nataicola]WNM07907.1 hypothetical protein RI056_12985 [Komagataeibacter nataicola]